MIHKIATAAVYVEDQREAVDFWTTKVGFQIQREMPMGPEASWIEVGPPGAQSYLVLYPKSMMQDWAERKPSIVFECDDLQQTFEDLRGRGVQFTQETTSMPWGLFAMFVDGEGNWYGLRESG